MPIRKRKESREQRRLARGSTRQGTVVRRRIPIWPFFAAGGGAVLVIVAALLLGSFLKARSDAYRQDKEEGNWTLDEQIATPTPVTVPNIRGKQIAPGESVSGIKHEGVILPLYGGDGSLLFTSSVAERAGLPVTAEPASLPSEVSRLQDRDLNVTVTFDITSVSESDPATAAYLRGLELALLREYAEAGMDDLLLTGLPAGSDANDRKTVDFLTDLRTLLSDLSSPPAVGVALPVTAFATDDTYTPPIDPEDDEMAGIPKGEAPLYAGNITPARIRNACDYLAMDLRGHTADEVADILPHIRYVYVRHSLRLLLDRASSETVDDVLSHGFERVFEMSAPVIS